MSMIHTVRADYAFFIKETTLSRFEQNAHECIGSIDTCTVYLSSQNRWEH